MDLRRLGPTSVIALLVLGCASSIRPDGDAPPPAATVGGTEHHRLVAKDVDQVFSIDVGTPIEARGRLPVVYVLAWDSEKLFADERTYAASARGMPVRVFLSAGALEIENGILETTRRFAEILRGRGYQGLELAIHVFPDETHESVLGTTISRGPRAVFGSWPVAN